MCSSLLIPPLCACSSGESVGVCVLDTVSEGTVRTTPALLPISTMPRNSPAILPSQPERPNTRYAAAISPAMFNPDTLPPPRFRKKPLSMLNNPPPEAARRKSDTPFSFESAPPTASPMAETVSPALSFSSFMSSVVPARASVADLPTTASLTIRATLLSVVSFSQPT